MAELLGAIASGVGIASFAIQLADSVSKLKKFCEDIKDAPEDLRRTMFQLGIVTLQLKEIADEEQANPQIFASNASLQQCVALCQQGSDSIGEIGRELEAEMAKRKIFGKLKVVLKKDTLSKLALRLESAKANLMMSYMIYSNGIRRQDTQLIVTEIQKVHVSTQQLHIASSANNGNVSFMASTATAPNSPRPQAATAQQNSTLPSSNRLGPDHNDEVETGIVSQAASRKRQTIATGNTYRLRFPLWITTRVWELKVFTLQNGWTTTFRTYNIIPHGSPVFELCINGDIQGLKELFASRKASPFDMDADGRTLLHGAALSVYPFAGKLQLYEFLISQGVDPARRCIYRSLLHSEDPCTAAEVAMVTYSLFYTRTPAQEQEPKQHCQVFRALLHDADVEFSAARCSHPLSHCVPAVVVTEIKRHMYDPPFEQLTMEQRLEIAIGGTHDITSYERRDSLDTLFAKIGAEPASNAVAHALCSGEVIMWHEMKGIIMIYASRIARGDRRAMLDLPRFIAAVTSQGLNVHESELMETFIQRYYNRLHRNIEYTTIESERSTELVLHALGHWLTALSTAGIDIKTFWEARCKLGNSDTGLVFNNLDVERELVGFRVLVHEYGPFLEDWRVNFSWRACHWMVPETLAREFLEMLDHPERQMAGAWNHAWDRTFDDELFDMQLACVRRRDKPSRHWIKRARQLSSGRLETILRWWGDSDCRKRGWEDDCLDCTEYCDSVEWFGARRPYQWPRVVMV